MNINSLNSLNTNNFNNLSIKNISKNLIPTTNYASSNTTSTEESISVSQVKSSISNLTNTSKPYRPPLYRKNSAQNNTVSPNLGNSLGIGNIINNGVGSTSNNLVNKIPIPSRKSFTLESSEQINFKQIISNFHNSKRAPPYTMKTSNNLYNKYNLINYSQEDNNKNMENTLILSANIKLEGNEVKTLDIYRYDDIYNTIKTYCESNKLAGKFIKPLVMKVTDTLSNIYKVYNVSLDKKEELYIKYINNLFNKTKIEFEIEDDTEKETENDILEITSISNVSLFENDLVDGETEYNFSILNITL